MPRPGDLRVAVSRALHLVRAVTLYLTIVFVLGFAMNSKLYCPRTIQRETKGTFRPSRNVPLGSFCISALGRPCSLPEDSSHGRGRELFDVVERISSHAPCASCVNPGAMHSTGCSRLSKTFRPGLLG